MKGNDHPEGPPRWLARNFAKLSDEQIGSLWQVDSFAVRLSLLVGLSANAVIVWIWALAAGSSQSDFRLQAFAVGFAVATATGVFALVAVVAVAWRQQTPPLGDVAFPVRVWMLGWRFVGPPVLGRSPHRGIYAGSVVAVAAYVVGFAVLSVTAV